MRIGLWREITGLGAAALAAVLALACSAAAEPARRIVSLNLCIDPIVLDLVPRERIQALSWVSSDPNVSPIIDRIAGIRLVRGTAEEVLALEPDLVLAGAHTTPATVDLLRRLGQRVEVIPMATTIEGIAKVIRAIAAAVGEPARGEAMVADFDRRLAKARAHGPERPEAVVYQANSIVSPSGTLAAAALEAAGFSNAADRVALTPGERIDLETLVVNPPDLVALGQQATTYRTPVADNLRHPALAHVLAERAHVDLPMPLWLCGTPHVADAVATLARARRAILEQARN
ncbi:MAG: ABC transporter substrate-binding protein [Hyphomicrobiaceae bacterium]|nr:ABC transporter substrate-binding protein [Hyphomicrobiaceae bacterium]